MPPSKRRWQGDPCVLLGGNGELASGWWRHCEHMQATQEGMPPKRHGSRQHRAILAVSMRRSDDKSRHQGKCVAAARSPDAVNSSPPQSNVALVFLSTASGLRESRC